MAPLLPGAVLRAARLPHAESWSHLGAILSTCELPLRIYKSLGAPHRRLPLTVAFPVPSCDFAKAKPSLFGCEMTWRRLRQFTGMASWYRPTWMVFLGLALTVSRQEPRTSTNSSSAKVAPTGITAIVAFRSRLEFMDRLLLSLRRHRSTTISASLRFYFPIGPSRTHTEFSRT